MFSEFKSIAYLTKRGDIKGNMKYKTLKSIMVGYTQNYIIYTYRLYNLETKILIVSRDIKWSERKKDRSGGNHEDVPRFE